VEALDLISQAQDLITRASVLLNTVEGMSGLTRALHGVRERVKALWTDGERRRLRGRPLNLEAAALAEARAAGELPAAEGTPSAPRDGA
jgi:hypothetical protein